MTILYCHTCLTLESVSNFPNLISIICTDCPNLRSLNNLPKIKVVTCTNCPKLQVLALPDSAKVNHKKCPGLEPLPLELNPKYNRIK